METGETTSLAAGAAANLGIKIVMSQTATLIPPDLLDPRRESLPPPPPRNLDFSHRLDGVVIPVWEGDIYLAKACCASVRQGMGDIPITLFVDGPATDTHDLQRLHGVEKLVLQEVVEPEIARLCTGNSWVKLPLFWMSPYRRFLCIDADLLVWGDLREYAEFDKYDFIAAYHFSGPVVVETPEKCPYDAEVVKRLDPALDWQGQIDANNGVFFAQRGIFAKEDLIKLRQLNCWHCFENGLVNYLRWKGARDGVLRAGGYNLQLFSAEKSMAAEDRFLPRNWRQPAIIHWISKKPRLGRRYQASDDYRKLFLQMTGRTKWLEARLFLEDVTVWLKRQRRSLNRRRQQSNKANP